MHSALTVAPFGERQGPPALRCGTQSGLTGVAVGGAAAQRATGGEADTAESAGTAGEQGRVTGQRGEEGEGEGTLTLEDALWRAEA